MTPMLDHDDLLRTYRGARDDAELSLAGWRSAPSGAKRDAFAFYRAAADREDAAAQAWLAVNRA
jgi:hypothetical protein